MHRFSFVTYAERFMKKTFVVRKKTQQRHLLLTLHIWYDGLLVLIRGTFPLICEALVYRIITFWSKDILM